MYKNQPVELHTRYFYRNQRNIETCGCEPYFTIKILFRVQTLELPRNRLYLEHLPSPSRARVAESGGTSSPSRKLSSQTGIILLIVGATQQSYLSRSGQSFVMEFMTNMASLTMFCIQISTKSKISFFLLVRRIHLSRAHG